MIMIVDPANGWYYGPVLSYILAPYYHIYWPRTIIYIGQRTIIYIGPALSYITSKVHDHVYNFHKFTIIVF